MPLVTMIRRMQKDRDRVTLAEMKQEHQDKAIKNRHTETQRELARRPNPPTLAQRLFPRFA